MKQLEIVNSGIAETTVCSGEDIDDLEDLMLVLTRND
jgi:hypothetical protein